MIAGRQFHFRPVLTICAALGLAILVSLGSWQLQRLAWKEALIEKVEARASSPPLSLQSALDALSGGEDLEYARIRIEGVFDHDGEAHVFGTYEGQPGYYIFTPMILTSGERIYVNRGFALQNRKSQASRQDSLVSGAVVVTGLIRAAEKRKGVASFFQPADNPDANRWFVRDPARFAAEGADALNAFYVDSDGSENAAEWPKGGTTRLEFRNRHLEYALTWFGLAGALLAVWMAFSLKSSEK
ncbi:MAG: SURF1 family protein [Pseudomonadota bacterium]